MGFLGVATWNPGIRVSRGSRALSILNETTPPSSWNSYLARFVPPPPLELVYAKPLGTHGPQKESFTITAWQRDKEGYEEDVKFEAFDRSDVTEFGIASITRE